MVVLIVIQFLIIGGLIWYIQSRDNRLTSLKEIKIATTENFLRTTAAGIFQRFSHEEDNETISSLFLTETHEDFISFAAQIIQRTEGGSIYLTHHSTYGHPHFEIERADGKYVGMAIVQSTDLTYEIIALLHSHLIQEQAQGGYVITTSDFTSHTYQYAKNLEVELINGKQLATAWLDAMDYTRYEEEPYTRSNRVD